MLVVDADFVKKSSGVCGLWTDSIPAGLSPGILACNTISIEYDLPHPPLFLVRCLEHTARRRSHCERTEMQAMLIAVETVPGVSVVCN